jgi:PTH1 family peptidyl-tRNA hydrolase
VGFALVGFLGRALGASFRIQDGIQDGVEIAGPADVDGGTVLLARPQCFMNRSGPPLRRLLSDVAVPCERLLVACDDVNLPLGRVRLRPAGSSGGHRGLKSMIEEVGEGFPRLRMGVGAPPPGQEPGQDLADWVLAPFTEHEATPVTDMLARAAGLVRRCWAAGRVDPVTSDPRPSTGPTASGATTGADDD